MTKKKRLRKERKVIPQKIYDLVQKEVEEAMQDLFNYWMATLWKGKLIKYFIFNQKTKMQEELFLDWEESKLFLKKLEWKKKLKKQLKKD